MPDSCISDGDGCCHGSVERRVRHYVDSHHHHGSVSQLLVHPFDKCPILETVIYEVSHLEDTECVLQIHVKSP